MSKPEPDRRARLARLRVARRAVAELAADTNIVRLPKGGTTPGLAEYCRHNEQRTRR